MPNITKRFVESAKPKPGQADSVYFDDKLSGFGLRVKENPAPTIEARRYVRSFLIQYRNLMGTSTRLTLGRYPAMTAEAARRQAKIKLGAVEEGKDPAQEIREARGAMTVKGFCAEYLEAANNRLIPGKGGKPKKASTIAIDKGRISRHIEPLLGKKAVRDVTHSDVATFFEEVARGRTAADIKTGKRGRAIVKGGIGTAKRVVGLLGSIFSYAILKGLREDNPVHGLKRPADGKREHRLDLDGYRALGAALAKAESEGENPAAIAAVKLLALTGCRLNEIAALRHSEIDRKRQSLRLADSKEGGSVRPLSAAALRVIDGLPDALKGQRHVLPGETKGKPYSALPKA
ncbi:MAG TPA: integrase arm-type DNA-binding domain-containing protein, partial [Alphaproteobacteria bacterium]|nr:integrase arm-type DNA-binding domain-containing protein [Alphaproteobacteria bacterium]